jgi:hypothetical protein
VTENKKFVFPKDLLITEANRNRKRQLSEFNSDDLIAFVSDDCPVSMVQTIRKVRQIADQKKDTAVIVAPLQKLSEKHLIMNRMVSRGKIVFINDERWIEKNVTQKIQLPLFMRIGDSLE